MKPEEQRVKIAEACGWRHTSQEVWRTGKEHFFVGGMGEQSKKWIDYLPDYLNDLNACHEMETFFHSHWDEQQQYVRELQTAVYTRKHSGESIEFAMTNATAPQRCEAFLRTLGLWQDDPAKSS